MISFPKFWMALTCGARRRIARTGVMKQTVSRISAKDSSCWIGGHSKHHSQGTHLKVPRPVICYDLRAFLFTWRTDFSSGSVTDPVPCCKFAERKPCRLPLQSVTRRYGI